MTEPLAREEIVALLERLGNADDGDVLTAARALHDKVAAAGLSWDALLVADAGADDASPASPEDEMPEDEIPEDDAPDETAVEVPLEPEGDRTAETLRLIDALLAKPGISADFREELEGYKTDIAEGEFDDNDHRYIRAVHKRLNDGRQSSR